MKNITRRVIGASLCAGLMLGAGGGVAMADDAAVPGTYGSLELDSSADPNDRDAWQPLWDEAQRHYLKTSGANRSGDVDDVIEAMIDAAEDHAGVPYAWGGGSILGPTVGSYDEAVHDSDAMENKDWTIEGFDCARLVNHALYEGAGMVTSPLTRTLSEELRASGGFEEIKDYKAKDVKKGDILFFGENLWHVAIATKDGKGDKVTIAEAAPVKRGNKVGTNTVKLDDDKMYGSVLYRLDDLDRVVGTKTVPSQVGGVTLTSGTADSPSPYESMDPRANEDADGRNSSARSSAERSTSSRSSDSGSGGTSRG